MRSLSSFVLTAALLALGTSCDGTISVVFSTGPQDFQVDTSELDLPTAFRDDDGNIRSVPCGPMGMCPPSETVTLTCERDVCDPAPKTVSAPVGTVIDVDMLLSETREVISSVDSYTFEQIRYEVSLNTLTFPVNDVEIFWGPEAATAIDPALGVRRLGTVPAVAAGATPSGDVILDPAGAQELS
ncbi:MAG: hypothetical protein RID93_20965, partial [Sandaracinaceae bacterium]